MKLKLINRKKAPVYILAAALVAAVLVTGCSASVEESSGGGGGPVPQPEPFQSKITGPILDGRWLSGCEEHAWSENYIVFDIEIKGQSLVRKETQFADAKCSQGKKSTVSKGLFRYLQVYANGVYQIEMKLEAGNGGYVLPLENIQLKGSTLYISDRYTGDTVIPNIALNPATPTPPNPGPNPESPLTPFVGQWHTACVANQQEVYTILDAKVHHEIFRYSETPCRILANREESIRTIKIIEAGKQIEIAGEIFKLSLGATQDTLSTDTAKIFKRTAKQASSVYQPIYAATCPNFSGMWQMNSFYFRITQDGCTRISRNGEGVPSFASRYKEFDFLPDGTEWIRDLYSFRKTKTRFEGDKLVMEYDYLKDGIVRSATLKMYFSKRPCNLMNPNGTNYLVEETFEKGQQIACDYYAKQPY